MDDVDSISVYMTAGIPAEYGSQDGGRRPTQYRPRDRGRPARTDGPVRRQLRYRSVIRPVAVSFGEELPPRQLAHRAPRLPIIWNPVVPGNYTDGRLNERDLSQSYGLSLSVRHELSRYEIPNELVQEQGGPTADR